MRAKIITLEDDLSFEKRLREKDNKINEDRINSLTYELTTCADQSVGIYKRPLEFPLSLQEDEVTEIDMLTRGICCDDLLCSIK